MVPHSQEMRYLPRPNRSDALSVHTSAVSIVVYVVWIIIVPCHFLPYPDGSCGRMAEEAGG